ncbi:hypothetical protein Tco_0598530 [Tanacetum coccineum]
MGELAKGFSGQKYGGLGVGNIKAKHLGLIGKWKWRFLNERGALWRKVITEIHGPNGGFEANNANGLKSERSLMADIHSSGLIVGLMIRWSWRRQPNGRANDELSSLYSLISGLVLNYSRDDTWTWSLEASGVFSVLSLSNLMQKKMLDSGVSSLSFRWNSWVPRKINVCAWRVSLNRLPT